jgi:formate/nitrite transporter FocA (FNT family)
MVFLSSILGGLIVGIGTLMIVLITTAVTKYKIGFSRNNNSQVKLIRIGDKQ